MKWNIRCKVIHAEIIVPSGSPCDNFQRYCECVSGIYPKGFEPK